MVIYWTSATQNVLICSDTSGEHTDSIFKVEPLELVHSPGW